MGHGTGADAPSQAPWAYRVWSLRPCGHFSAPSRTLLATFPAPHHQAGAAGEHDFRIFSASIDNTMRLWDPYDMACIRVLEESISEVSAMTYYEGWNIVVTGEGVYRIGTYRAVVPTRLGTLFLHHRDRPAPEQGERCGIQPEQSCCCRRSTQPCLAGP
jgi:hypothetical protein